MGVPWVAVAPAGVVVVSPVPATGQRAARAFFRNARARGRIRSARRRGGDTPACRSDVRCNPGLDLAGGRACKARVGGGADCSYRGRTRHHAVHRPVGLHGLSRLPGRPGQQSESLQSRTACRGSFCRPTAERSYRLDRVRQQSVSATAVYARSANGARTRRFVPSSRAKWRTGY